MRFLLNTYLWRYAVRDAPDPDRPAKSYELLSTRSPNVIDLGVNIDHVATLRNARGTVVSRPDRAPPSMAERPAPTPITLHLREDRRHIVDADVRALRPLLKTRMNLGMRGHAGNARHRLRRPAARRLPRAGKAPRS